MPRADFIAEVESGDRLRALVALRGELARAIADGTDEKALASLALRLTRVLEQIEEMGGEQEEEPDELAARRDAKLSASAGP